MRKLFDLSVYEILSVKKPGAILNQVMENIEIITKDFTLEDFVIISGGSNDIDLKKIPSFRFICNKLKLCTHTNILFTSVPYITNSFQKNKHTYKYNAKLNDFLIKFNNCTKGLVQYVEVNNPKFKYFNHKLVASSARNIIINIKSMNKTLTFINIVNKNINTVQMETINLELVDDLPTSSVLNEPTLESVNYLPLSVELNQSNFLCPGQPKTPFPRLS